jgi:hypothetical protein
MGTGFNEMRSTSFSTLILAGLSLATMGGCGGRANKLGTVSAGGTVTYRGAALAGATVTLAPQSGQRPAVGLSDEAGRFRLTTLAARDGAMPGAYKVTVTKTDEAVVPKNVAAMSVEEMRAYEAEMIKGPPDFQEPVHLLPKRYGSPETTPFTCEVKPTGENDFVFQLTD